jgi:TonB family protein
MIASTALQMLVVSIAATGAALAAEAGLRRVALPTRWAWLAALALPPLFVLATLVPPITAMIRHPGTAAMVVVPLDGFTVGAGDPGPTWVDGAVAAVWALSVAAFLTVLLRGYLQLARERRGWSRTSLIGGTVYASLERGPAVGGLIRPWIVIPAWVLRLPPRELRWVLVHEGQHVRAGDPRLLAGALALLALTPWNRLAWWQLRRLRAAMEVDCDRRVLAQERDLRRYGNTLLTVAAQITPEGSLGLAAFSESAESLHRRILAMTARRSRWSVPAGAMLLVLAVLVALQACGLYGPVEPETVAGTQAERPAIVRPQTVFAPQPPVTSEPPAPEPSVQPPEAEPSPFEPSSVEPRLLNADEVVDELRRRFEEPRGPAEPPVQTEPEEEPPPPLQPGEDMSARPVFTPFTVAPVMRNRAEVAAALEREYPALLRDAGVGGRTIVWVRLDTNGVVQDAQINTSSGVAPLDQAALNVARQMEFSPAMNRDEIVPVWVSIPIQFQSR